MGTAGSLTPAVGSFRKRTCRLGLQLTNSSGLPDISTSKLKTVQNADNLLPLPSFNAAKLAPHAE